MFKDCTHAIAWETTARKAAQKQQQPAVPWRRGRGIFPPMSVVPANDGTPDSATAGTEDEPDQGMLAGGGSSDHGNDHDVERFLSNGDFYAGTWSRNLPHGAGKYLWSDGCMYVGEWRHGSTTGTGKFSWPSGATYEGQFRSGFMDGVGTFTGSSGDTYHGSWSMNFKHGWGKKSYSNGDYYNGEWRRGSQDGHGRYVWSSGDEYTGSWKTGAMHGKGVLTWANGNCYDGDWEGGVPCGKGQFRRADGSCYVGLWSKGVGAEESVFYPSEKAQNWWGTEASFLQKQEAWRLCKPVSSSGRAWPRRRASAAGRRAQMRTNSSGGTNLGKHAGEFDEICIWESEDDNTWCDIVDGSAVAGAERGRDDDGSGGVHQEEGSKGNAVGRHLMNWVPRGVRMQGETIAAGHRNYELMLSLQLGIRHSVAKTAPATTLDPEASAFDTKEKVWTRFPPEGTKHTPPHQSSEFKWKDYCPEVFRTLREIFKIDAADYMISICGNDALRKLSSPGKSGSLFYLSHDDRYMIKTIKKSEVKVLLRMLPAYYNHVRAFESSLVTKFFGLHSVKFTGPMQRKIRFIVMGNLFFSEYCVHRRFDLKGSSHGRITDKPDVEINETSTLKDLDLNLIFWLHRSWFQKFRRQILRDCEFLEQERVMDYSLLVGLHFRGTSMPKGPLMDKDVTGLSSAREATSHLPRADMDKFQNDTGRAAIKLGVNMPARVQQTQRCDCDSQPTGEPTGDLFDVVLFFGIIDILQDYDISKKLEHAYKSFHYDPSSISAVDPKQYSRRFRQFIFKVFREDSYDDTGCLTIAPVSIR